MSFYSGYINYLSPRPATLYPVPPAGGGYVGVTTHRPAMAITTWPSVYVVSQPPPVPVSVPVATQSTTVNYTIVSPREDPPEPIVYNVTSPRCQALEVAVQTPNGTSERVVYREPGCSPRPFYNYSNHHHCGNSFHHHRGNPVIEHHQGNKTVIRDGKGKVTIERDGPEVIVKEKIQYVHDQYGGWCGGCW